MAVVKRRVEFKVAAPEAEQVLLAGSFNAWSTSSDPMRRDNTGTWKKTKMLSQGRYEYKFIVDGVWRLDPTSFQTVPNEYGTENNVIEV